MSDPVPQARDVMARLPRTFVPALNGQLRQWDLLFPAEQRQTRAQIEWLAQLPSSDFKRLFAPVFDVESRMQLPRWDPAAAGMTVREVGLLARSPLYPQWRAAVESVFSSIDDASQSPARVPRLVVTVLPSGVPLSSQPLWPALSSQGAWVPLKKPFGEILTGFATAVSNRNTAPGLEDIESTWIFECDTRLSPLAESSKATVFSWAALAAARREFLNRLNRISRDLRAVDQTNEELMRLDLRRFIAPPGGTSPRLREFARGLMLSGNGSLVFNNSFVQWGASEALRRAQPQALFAAFGIRPKLKPFSSTVLFEDQKRSNPAADADDPEGSLIDSLELAEYVYLSAQRVTAYQGRSLTLLAACDLDQLLVLGPRPPVPAAGRLEAENLLSFALDWLSRQV